MTQDMTEMIITERNTYRKTESAHCHTVDKEMATCTQGATKVYPRCTQALGRLMSMLRSSLGAPKEQLRSTLGAPWSMPTLCLHSAVMAILMMVVGVNEALAQTDYSGTYYIASYAKVPNSNPAQYVYDPTDPNNQNNFYLCPSDGWIYYKKDNKWIADKASSDGPFLTTFKCRTNDYDAQGGMNNAKWVVTKHGNYYTFYHTGTSKYLVLSGQISGCGADRMRVHLEEITSPETPGDNALFTIAPQDQGLSIAPKTISGDRLTVNGGNKEALTGQSGKTGGPKGTGYNYENTAGIVGIYRGTGTDDNRYFYLEDYITRPLITYNSNNRIEITDQTGSATAIYYTTDGTTPTTSSTLYEGAFDPAEGVTTIKAIVVVGGEASNVAVYTTPVLCGNTHSYLIQSQNNGWTIDETTTDFHFYMVPGDEANNVKKVNTTSLFRPSMEWHFESAGEENGLLFYYIVNNSAKDNENNPYYLCYDATNNVYMETFSENDKFKFKIVESATAGSFNIIPYAQRNASGNTNRFVNKPNDGNNQCNAGHTPINLSSTSNAWSQWKFVQSITLDKIAPFTVSDNDKTVYYNINSVGSNGYYIVPPSGTNTNATTSNSTDENVIKTGAWYFEKAQDATNDDWLTYYHIRNAETGKYLYFTKEDNNAGACLIMKETLESGNEDRYMFTWAKTAATEANYYIIPKLLKDKSLNKFSALQRDNGTLKTNLTRGAGNYAWTFVSAPFCLDPVITQAVNREVTITCPTSGVTIYYTTDGSDPVVPAAGDAPEAPTMLYSAFTPDESVNQIKAIAVNVNDNNAQSEIVTFALPKYTYHIVNVSKGIAASSSAIQQAAGTPLSGDASIPEALRSPYISDEAITFYTMEGDFDANKLDNEHKITATPANSADIYVTYTTDKLSDKFLHFQGARPFNFKDSSGKYLIDNGTAVEAVTNAETSVTDRNYLWYFYGSDPYNIQIRNANSNKYLTISGSAPARSDVAVPFFLTEQSGEGATSRHITLKNVSNGETIGLNINTVVLPLSYTLIDRENKVIERGISYDADDGLKLPVAWRSPLVDYHYWNADAFEQAVSGTPDEPFVFVANPTEITNATEATNNVIYVTYTLKSDNTIDLDGRDLLNNRGGALGATYRLKFTGGQTFNQEDGLDGVSESPTKAVYPYSNGDASLYVYGEDQWTTQLESGASTRSRWLWYLEPAKGVLDPYHVRVSSYQNQTNYTDPDTKKVVTNFHSYLRTYKPEEYSEVVTGVTNNNPLAQGHAASATAETNLPEGSEYMLLGTDLSNLKLVTVDAIDGSRRTVNSFEQYWKNNPTVNKKLPTEVTTAGRNVTLSDDQKAKITDWGWHVYKEYANSAPWAHNNDGTPPTTSKKFLKEEHAYQTISMGETFSLVETAIDPMLILLDQHGWEIARVRLPSGPDDPKRAERYAEIHKYSSPMVARYHFWKTGSKVPGYHKYKVSDYATISDTNLNEYTADELGRADITNPLTPANLPNYETQAFAAGKERDWYVTYDVKDEYTSAYTGAATEDGTSSVPYLVKQGGKYAKINGTSLETEETEPNIEDVPQELRWYVKPNFDIDEEMGYLYAGETGAQEDAKSKDETELDYFDHTREGAVPSWSNGFDPYNVQIKSAVPETDRYFTANTTGSTVTSSWSGTSSSISLQNMTETSRQPGVMGLDQTHMKITNATFMVLDDGNGNMRLVPRFDNTKVMQNFTTLASPGEAAAADDKGASSQTIFLTKVPEVVKNSSEITVMGGTYLLSSTFSASGSIGTKDAPFTGTIEGQIGSSFDVSAPFIAYAQDAVIKNVIIESSSVRSGNTDGHAGAIVATATGNTRIYNCGVNGGSVSGTNYVGGIVGLLDGSARVINCYSYADITGGSTVGGIVGYNNYESKSDDLRTMVMNCMFYGNIDYETITEIAPIYNGKIISNVGSKGLGNYNYFLAEKPYVEKNKIKTYNCALMAEERFLNRFEFFRLLMNSHLELAGWYATGNYDKSEMMKWVLETADRTIAEPKPYPVLKAPGKYPSIINYDAKHAPRNASVGRNNGKQMGSLSVTINESNTTTGGQTKPTGATVETTSLTLVRTDKDFGRFNFNYDKVQLPYYNDVGTGNYTKNRVVTGWKITSITGGTSGDYNTTGADATTDADGNIASAPYNFADRNYTNKDLYSVSGRIFNQGAYWDVPEGVTAITIEPYWAEAVYLADSHADVVYNTTMTDRNDVSNVGGGEKYANGNTYSIAGDNQKVYTSMDNARKQITTGKTVYDCAIVLVGNAHNIGVPSAEGNRSYTIMSADFDHDNEPDYSYILRFNGRTECHPVRTDFVNIPGLGMAQKSTGGTGSYNFGILIPKGWFESTNTSLFRFTQFEYEHKDHPADAPLILQGGVMEQWVSNNQKGTSNNIPYIHVGGNVWFKEFHTGCHQDKQIATKHSPISVTGGDYDEFYLTGLYRGDITNKGDNAECYINGGRFGTVCGAAMEGIGNANGGNNTGNIVWQIQNADIHEFYSTTITDSYVDIFCGGPKFGDMSANKTVHTKATGCTFGTYFGAGYGGNSYSRYAPSNQNNVTNINWNNWLNGQYKQEYNATYGGVSTQFNYQFLPMSDNAILIGNHT